MQMPKLEKIFSNMDEENVAVLSQILTDPQAGEPLKVKILSKFIEAKKGRPFFETMLEEKLDFGSCPNCGHEDHWLVPEEALNQRGIVSSTLDPRVKNYTTERDCPEFKQACIKKKVGF